MVGPRNLHQQKKKKRSEQREQAVTQLGMVTAARDSRLSRSRTKGAVAIPPVSCVATRQGTESC